MSWIRIDSEIFQTWEGHYSFGRGIRRGWDRMTERDIPEAVGIQKEVKKLCDGDFVFWDMGKRECGEFR